MGRAVQSVPSEGGGFPIESRIVRAFTLEPVPPFRLDLTAWALRRRQHNVVDRWDGETYRRALRLSEGVAEIEVRQVGPCEAPRLEVLVAAEHVMPAARAEVTAMLQRMLGLDIDLHDFYRRAAGDLHLRPLVDRFQGLKPPRFPSVFECLVNAIACQQLTLTVGIGLLNRLADRYGRATIGPALTVPCAFPDPGDLATADPDAVRKLGLSTAKARAVVGLAKRIAEGSLDLEKLADVDDAAACAAIQGLRGLGPWSPSTHCCAGSDGSACSQPTTWAHATICSGCSVWTPVLTPTLFGGPWRRGHRTPGSSTSISCSNASTRPAGSQQAEHNQDGTASMERPPSISPPEEFADRAAGRFQ